MVSRGGKFVFAQSLADVIQFLELKVKQQERLSPDELVKKLELVLPSACRYIRQIPPEQFDKTFRNRNRPIRVLCHHVFRIVEGFLESMQDGKELTYERIMQEAPGLRTGEAIASFGESVLARSGGSLADRRSGCASTTARPSTWCWNAPPGIRRSTRAS